MQARNAVVRRPYLSAVFVMMLSATLVSKARADMGAAEISQANKAINAVLAPIVATAKAQRGNYAGAAAARGAGDLVEQCFLVTGRSNIGDLSANQLAKLKSCVAGHLSRLADRMQALKVMQDNSKFDYAVFAESVRLLSTKDVGAVAAVSPIRKMLDAARAASSLHSEKIVLQRLTKLTDKITKRLGSGPV